MTQTQAITEFQNRVTALLKFNPQIADSMAKLVALGVVKPDLTPQDNFDTSLLPEGMDYGSLVHAIQGIQMRFTGLTDPIPTFGGKSIYQVALNIAGA